MVNITKCPHCGRDWLENEIILPHGEWGCECRLDEIYKGLKMRPYTKEETRRLLLGHFRDMASYWSAESLGLSKAGSCECLVFSILNMLDGCEPGFPAVDLVLSPHQDDENDAMENGANWFKQGMVINDDCMLHKLWANI